MFSAANAAELTAALSDDGGPQLGRSMPTDLADQLRTQIHGGQLGPGDRLPNERDLATLLGVGRITVREAIRMLVEEGYLVSKRGNSGGTFVSDLAKPQRLWLERIRQDPTWFTDLIEYRKAVEMRAAELAAKRRSREHLAEMKAAISQGADPESRHAFRQADHRFHVCMAQASGSERLVDATIRARGELFLPVDRMSFEDHYEQTRAEHGLILDAIRRRDAPGARDAVERHLQASLQDFMEMVVERGS